MDCRELDFIYPRELVGTEPSVEFRAVFSGPAQGPIELDREGLFDLFHRGDVLVFNDTKVVKRRVFSTEGLEVLFIHPISEREWEVLFPVRQWNKNKILKLPGGRKLKLLEGGRPQKVILNKPIGEGYFQRFGEMALPPYIQRARDQRHMKNEDEKWYQTQWAMVEGSCAAPTASLHFSNRDLEALRVKGVIVVPMTLHIGLGTFLPIHVDHLDDHKMHCEWTKVPRDTIQACEKCEGQIWALGSTVARSLESYGLGLLEKKADGSFSGQTDLFIRPGFEFKYVDVLMTNFHQPRSTLLSMVYSFAGIERTREVYRWAMDKKFRLFSYGDLSIWQR